MLKFQTNGVNGSKIFNLPTRLEEITSDYLLAVTNDIELADNHVLVALCYREKLSTIIMTARQNKKSVESSVVPLFIKSGKVTNATYEKPFINKINTCDTLIVSGSQLALGYHVSCPKNTLNVNTLIHFVEKDGYAYQNAIKVGEYIYFLEFKILPACDIIAFRNKDEIKFDNPFTIEDAVSGELN